MSFEQQHGPPSLQRSYDWRTSLGAYRKTHVEYWQRDTANGDYALESKGKMRRGGPNLDAETELKKLREMREKELQELVADLDEKERKLRKSRWILKNRASFNIETPPVLKRKQILSLSSPGTSSKFINGNDDKGNGNDDKGNGNVKGKRDKKKVNGKIKGPGALSLKYEKSLRKRARDEKQREERSEKNRALLEEARFLRTKDLELEAEAALLDEKKALKELMQLCAELMNINPEKKIEEIDDMLKAKALRRKKRKERAARRSELRILRSQLGQGENANVPLPLNMDLEDEMRIQRLKELELQVSLDRKLSAAEGVGLSSAQKAKLKYSGFAGSPKKATDISKKLVNDTWGGFFNRKPKSSEKSKFGRRKKTQYWSIFSDEVQSLLYKLEHIELWRAWHTWKEFNRWMIELKLRKEKLEIEKERKRLERKQGRRERIPQQISLPSDPILSVWLESLNLRKYLRELVVNNITGLADLRGMSRDEISSLLTKIQMKRLQKLKFIKNWEDLTDCLENVESEEETTASTEIESTSISIDNNCDEVVIPRERVVVKEVDEEEEEDERVLQLRQQLKQRHATTGQLFQWMDKDKGNQITIMEFAYGLTGIGIRPVPSDDEIRSLFASFDKDGNHSVSYAEMLDALEGGIHGQKMDSEGLKVSKAKRALETMMSRNSGKIGMREKEGWKKKKKKEIKIISPDILLKEMKRLHRTTGHLFSWMDSDRSNTLTFKEFVNGLAGIGIRPMPTDEECHALFHSFALDEDHCLSYKGLITALEL
eukprot:g150.t1